MKKLIVSVCSSLVAFQTSSGSLSLADESSKAPAISQTVTQTSAPTGSTLPTPAIIPMGSATPASLGSPTITPAAPGTAINLTGSGTSTAPGNSTATATTTTVTTATVSKANRPVRDKWALIVGITQFSDPKIPKLKYATKDAADFYNYLVKDGQFAPDHVRILLNEKATRSRILSELGNKFLARVADPDDFVVLFFSTHGSPSQMDVKHDNYLIAYDTNPDELFSTGIDMSTVTGVVRDRIDSKRVMLVLDACHSGATKADAKGMAASANFDVQALEIGSGQMVICSSQPSEQSWESKRYQNGVFTKNFLDALRTGGATMTVNEAFDEASQRVEEEVREDNPSARQTPVLRSNWDGNLIVAVKPSKPGPIPDSVLSDLDPDSSGASPSKRAPDSAQSTSSSQMFVTDNSNEPPSPPTDALNVTRTYFSNDGNPRKALQAAFELKSQFFNDPQYKFNVAKLRIQLEEYQQANTELKGLLVDEPNNWQCLLAKAYCLHKLKQDGLAADCIRQAQFHNPTLPKKIVFAD